MYSWVAVLSFVHFSKDKLNPFEKEKIVKKFNPSPFSRTSTISGRGRRSFLLKSKEPKHQSVDSQDTSSNIERSNLLSPSSRVSLPKSHPGMSKYSRSMPEDGNHKRVKRIGGFIPSLLKRERTEIPEDQVSSFSIIAAADLTFRGSFDVFSATLFQLDCVLIRALFVAMKVQSG